MANFRRKSTAPITVYHGSYTRARTLSSGDGNVHRSRSIRRKKCYGGVELLVSTDSSGRIKNMGRFRVEPTPEQQSQEDIPSSPVLVENPQTETRWYLRYFLGKGTKKIVLCEPSSDQWLNIAENHSTELALLEDQEGSLNFKFGVIYREDGQNTDDQMLSNDEGSEGFNVFLRVLGNLVDLCGWGSFKANCTGEHSYYTRFEGHEIMFHVSTLLPLSHANPQQVERKRHIGNDIVNIIYEEGGDPAHPSFCPSMMKSQFTHIFAVIKWDGGQSGGWRVWIYSEESVPAYGPLLPNPAIFKQSDHLRDFLLTKLINGEKGAFGAVAFTEKRERTADSLLKDMYMEYIKEHCQYKSSFSKVWNRSGIKGHRGAPPSEYSTQEFVKLGELVRLERLLSGEVPEQGGQQGSICRKQPWEPHMYHSNFPYSNIMSADSWGKDSLVLATAKHGVKLVLNDGRMHGLIDSSVAFQQINILEPFGLLIARVHSGKESILTVMTLAEVTNAMQSGETLSQQHVLLSKVPETKGCHLYSMTDSNQLRLSVGVCIGRRILLLRWVLGPLGKAQPNTDLSNNFTILKEIMVKEDIVSMSLFETGAQCVVRAAIAASHALHLANFSTSIVTTVYRRPTDKGPIKCIHANSDREGLEIVLTYESTTAIFDPNHSEEVLEILWTSSPREIAYFFPFLVAFTGECMEVRLGVNGNLLATSYIPHIRLLVAKEDIYFMASDSQKKSGTFSIYRIKRGGNVSERQTTTVVSSSTSSKTPQMSRKPHHRHHQQHPHLNANHSNSDAGVAIEGRRRKKGGPLSTYVLENNMLRYGSTGSDSGVGRVSTSSTDGICSSSSVPPSPHDPFDK